MEKIQCHHFQQAEGCQRSPPACGMLIRRCCHAVLQLEHFADSAEISVSSCGQRADSGDEQAVPQ